MIQLSLLYDILDKLVYSGNCIIYVDLVVQESKIKIKM